MPVINRENSEIARGRNGIFIRYKKTGCAVTAEEHNIIGGLGDSIAQVAAKNWPVPMEYVGTNDTFGESGKPKDLFWTDPYWKENLR